MAASLAMDTYKTRLGGFRPRVPGETRGERLTYGESLQEFADYLGGEVERGAVKGLVRKNELEFYFKKEIAAWVDGKVPFGGRDRPASFRNVSGFAGYALGQGMDDRADPSHVFGMAGGLSMHMHMRKHGNPFDLRSYKGTISEPCPDPVLHGYSWQETVHHLEDSILIGYWDGQDIP